LEFELREFEQFEFEFEFQFGWGIHYESDRLDGWKATPH